MTIWQRAFGAAIAILSIGYMFTGDGSPVGYAVVGIVSFYLLSGLA